MLKLGIVGLPNVGKSTLFNALTEKSVSAENYPFCTIDPAVGVVSVPDLRLDKLSRMSQSKKTIHTAIEFVDIAGLVKGAHAGEGLGNKFLANIREVDAILEVVRIFEDYKVIHVDGKIDPMSDIEVINLELIMSDFQTVTKRIANLIKEVKNPKLSVGQEGNNPVAKELEILKRIEKVLDDGKLASEVKLEEDEEKIIKPLNLLTKKPILYALNKKMGGNNLDEGDPKPLVGRDKWDELLKFFDDTNSKWVKIDAQIEHELKDLSEDDRQEYKQSLGSSCDDIDRLIRAGYELLDLITYFTMGEAESRAWTVKRNSTAPQAGSAIHTDFQDKFIKADVINWQELLDCGNKSVARDKGLIRLEGKEYIVQDGDVIEFKI